MHDFWLRRLRHAPIVEPLWDEYERMQAERDAALAARDDALAAREAAEQMRCREPCWWLAKRQNFWFLSELRDGTRFWVRADDEFISRGIVDGSYEPAETAFVRRHVGPGMKVADIGANLGWFTVIMAMLVGRTGQVHAFEPRPDLFAYLHRTVGENRLGNVTLHQCALADADGDGIVVATEDDRNHGGSHLLAGNPCPSGHVGHRVPQRRLDGLIPEPLDFIKIDIEGAEKLALDGARETIGRGRPVILSEINGICLRRTSRIGPADYVAYFRGLGYEVRRIMPDGQCGDPPSPDELTADTAFMNIACLPREKLAALVQSSSLSQASMA